MNTLTRRFPGVRERFEFDDRRVVVGCVMSNTEDDGETVVVKIIDMLGRERIVTETLA